MSALPILPHHTPQPAEPALRDAERLAEELQQEDPLLTPPPWLQPLMPRDLCPGPTLHLDDLSGLTPFGRFVDVAFLEDRARFRAMDGDLVASCAPRLEVFETYCEEQLGLGRVRWLHPQPRSDPLRVAAACWTDRSVRQTLVKTLRRGRLRYVHPHMGSRAVWITASLLRRASRRPLQVLAPRPRLSRLVNDKAWFTHAVRRLLGERYTPRSFVSLNFTTLALTVRHLAPSSRRLVIKIPDSAGGAGNLVLDAERFRGLRVGEIRRAVHEMVRPFAWSLVDHLLVSSWETDVVCAPSTQLWVPPEEEGPPVVEGVFDQVVDETQGRFLGSRPAHLPPTVTRECVDCSWLLARLFQRMGYVGRCSFDLLLVGRAAESPQVQFIECNGRWGGTSAPMTTRRLLTMTVTWTRFRRTRRA